MNTYLSILGLALLVNLVGFFWLVVAGFKRSVVWGLLVFLLSPLTAIIFAVMNWFDARKPFLIYFASLLLVIGTSVYLFISAGSANMQQLSARLQSGEISIDEATRLFNKALSHSGQIDLFSEKGGADAPAVAVDAGARPDLPATTLATADTAVVQGDSDAAPDTPAATETDTPAVAQADTPEQAPAAQEEAATRDAGSDADTEPAAKQSVRPAYPTPGSTVPDPLAVAKPEQEEESVVIGLDKVSAYVGRYLIIDMKNGTQQRGFLIKTDGKSLMLNRKLYGGSMEYRVYTSRVKTVHVLKRGAEPKS